MGSWNATDMITHLPIREGEPVRMLVLKYQSGIPHLGSGFCYADDNWQPIGPAISAVYDDYGRPGNIKKDICAAWLGHVLPMNDEILKEISCQFGHKKPSKLDKKISGVERLLSKIDNEYLCLWMVHEKTWQMMMAIKFDSYMEEYLADREEEIKEMMPTPEDNPAVRGMGISIVAAKLYNYCHGANDPLHWVDPEHWDEMVDAIRELSKVKMTMELMRRYFCPMANCGSQNTGYDTHLKLAEFTVEMSRAGVEWEENS